ncbi:lipopolysaccharide biosynthesis protein [Halobacillus karajensis]|uniref:Colanic acid exporter n=1 Tax=Halobacillus karajensis TaxID=195088 RepID=A0A059NV91_9BACI|nr:oligosaccharide flippase family protein [Halobacillus karajensis]CDQ22980.1 colanic acid exporter [Halobacillus karajensis]CDQ26462.1 colanic acid exporter [Halobacillus karajensis]
MGIIYKIKQKVLANNFMKNILILVGGTVFAQGLVVLSSPLLTRMYTPEAFGILATFIAVVSILNSIVSLKYELALPLTESKKETINLFSLNFIITIIITLLYLLVFVFAGETILKGLGIVEYSTLLVWLIPVTVLFLGFTDNLTYLFVKVSRFKSITNLKVSNSFSKVVTQVLFGIIPSYPFGLILGDIVGRVVGAFVGLYSIVKYNIVNSYKMVKENISTNEMKKVLFRFKKFPMFSTPAGLINSLSTHLTPVVLVFAYDPVIAGFYSLTQRVLGLPSTLVSQSISQVYLNEAPKLLKKDISLVRNLYLKVTKNLLLFGGVPIFFLSIFGESIFSFIFGDKWADSGIYLQVLSLMFLGQFIVVPLSQTLNILNKQNIQLIWDIFRVLVSLFTIIYPSRILGLSPELTLLIYSISIFILYLLLYFITLYYLKGEGNKTPEQLE